MRNTKAGSYSSTLNNKAAPAASIGIISLQAHAAHLKRKTEVRRKLEDLRIAAQATHHPYQDKS